jgi:hypothetical protein
MALEGAPIPKTSTDLSEEIARTIERQPGDQVRCTRVTADTYRCNWWAPESKGGYDNPSMGGLLVTTHRVRKSQYLHVTQEGTALLIRPYNTQGDFPTAGHSADRAS